MRAGSISRRIWRITRIPLLIVLVPLAVAIGLLLLAPVRALLLQESLRRADGALPGNLFVGAPSWPGLSHLRLLDVRWTAGGDTLVFADTLDVDFYLRPLLRKDIRVQSLVARGFALDLPALRAAFPPGPDSVEAKPEKDGEGFPRRGALPGVPSIAVERFRLEGSWLRLSPDRSFVDLWAAGGLDLRRGAEGWVQLEDLRVTGPQDGVQVDRLSLTWLPHGPGELEADGAGRLGTDFPFVLQGRTESDGTFALSLLSREGAHPPVDEGLLATGRLLREGGDLTGVTGIVGLRTPGSRDLAKLPLLAGTMRNLPELPGLRLSAQGTYRFQDEHSGEIRVDLLPNGYVDGGLIAFSFRPGRLNVDTLSLDLPDLDLRGTLFREGDRQGGNVRARIRGRRWLRPFTDTEGLPDSVAIDVAAGLAGTTKEPLVDAQIRGAFRWDDLRIQDLAIDVEGNLGEDRGARLALTGRSGRLALATSGYVTFEDEAIEARLAPLVLTDLAEGEGVRLPALPGRDVRQGASHAVFDRKSGRLRLDGLRLAGSLGDGLVDGIYHGDDGGRFDVRLVWPRLPVALAHRVELTAEEARDLEARWRRERDLLVAASVRVHREPNGMAVEASGTLRVPGPRTLRPLLPQGVEVEDLGPLAGSFRARIVPPRSGASRLHYSIDLSETEWIRRFHAEGFREGGLTVVDTLDADFLGFNAHGRTSVRGQELDGRFDLVLHGEEVLHRFVPSLGDTLEARAWGQVGLSGTTQAPVIDASLAGRYISKPIALPEFTAELRRDGGGALQCGLRAPAGLRAASLEFDSLHAVLSPVETPPAPDGSRPLAGRVRLSGRGRELQIDHGFEFWQERGWIIDTDTLALVVRERDLRATRPFRFHLREDQAMVLDGLELNGSLGDLRAHGIYAAQRTDFTLEAGLNPPEQPAPIRFPPGLWPSRLDLRLRAVEGDTLALEADAHGLHLGTREDIHLAAHASGLGDQIAFRVHLEDRAGPDGVDKDVLADLHGTFAGSVSLSPFRFESQQGAFSAEAILRDFPLPAQAGNPMSVPGYLDRTDPDRQPVLDGLAHIEGTTRSPILQLAGIVRFPEYRDFDETTLRLQALVLPAERAAWPATPAVLGGSGSGEAHRHELPSSVGDTLEPVELAGLPPLPDPRPGLTAGISMVRRDTQILEGELSLPMRFSLVPAEADPQEERNLALRIEGRGINLEEIAPFFSSVHSLDGKADLRLTATGLPETAALDGEVQLRHAGVRLRDGTRAQGDGHVEVSGTMEAPVVRGQIRLDNGRILIPEADQAPHPVDEKALLWDRESFASTSPVGPFARQMTPEERMLVRREPAATQPASAEADSAVTQEAAEDPLRASTGEPPSLMERLDLGVKLRIPAGVWLEGRGYEAKLTGSLDLEQRDGSPVLTGTVEAHQGSIQLRGRGLDIQSGTVTFYGTEELNPSLDLVLERRQDDVTIRAHITGTFANPRLELESDPEMDQADIFSILLFGRPPDELSEKKNQQLDDRALATAEQYAASRLTARLSQEIGLDLLTYEQSSQDSLGRAVTLGKYLSPNLLLCYEQVLEQERGFEVVIQYFLGHGFTLQMRRGRGGNDEEGQSGVAVDWGQNF